jgi:hypothetical protein
VWHAAAVNFPDWTDFRAQSRSLRELNWLNAIVGCRGSRFPLKCPFLQTMTHHLNPNHHLAKVGNCGRAFSRFGAGFNDSAAARPGRILDSVAAAAHWTATQLRTAAFWAGIAVVTSCAMSNLAAAESKFESVEPGFSGEGRVGVWLPVQVRATGLPAGVDVVLQVESLDPSGNLLLDAVGTDTVSVSGDVAISGVFRTGRLEGTLRVVIAAQASGEVFCSQRIKHKEFAAWVDARPPGASPPAEQQLRLFKQETFCVLTVGAPAALQELQKTVLSQTSRDQSLPLRVLSVPSNDDLPVHHNALQSIDALVLQHDFAMSDQQVNAIRIWTQTGGRLLVSAGQNSAELTGSAVGQWLAIEFGLEAQPLRVRSQTLASFQSFVPGAKVLSTIGASVSILRIRSPNVTQDLSSIDGPLVARRGIGSGIVTVVAADLTQRPLSNWNSLPQLYEMLLFGKRLDASSGQEIRSARISTSGVNDLGTQLAAAFDAVPPKQRWSTWVVIAFFAVWILVAGPLDFLLVTRLLKRPHLTWLTFPIFVTAGCALIYVGQPETLESDVLRQVQLLDLSENDLRLFEHSRTWFSISANETRRSDVTVATSELLGAESVRQDSQLTWYGRPENVYGGMYRPGGAGLGRLQYSRVPDPDQRSDTLSAVPLPIGGSTAFQADRTAEFASNQVFHSTFSVAGTGLLDGEFEHALSAPIENWVIFHGNRVYLPSPNATEADRVISLGVPWTRHTRAVRASDLRSYLNGVRVVRSERENNRHHAQSLVTAWNSRGRDPMDILLMISLYTAAGGDSYVGLHNDQFRQDDLTDSIRLNYALILGTINERHTSVLIDGNVVEPTESTTIVRILAPVRLTESDVSARPRDGG